MAEVAMTDEVVEQGDDKADDVEQQGSVAEYSKQEDGVAVTDRVGEPECSVAEDGEQRGSVVVADDTSKPAPNVVIRNISSDGQTTNRAPPSIQRESTSTDVLERTRQPVSDHEPVNCRLGPTKQVHLSSPIPSLVSSIRNSALTAMKRTRQTLSEKLGRGSKTVDVELEARIESLRLIQNRYSTLMLLARSFNVHFTALVNCQQSLAAEFSNLSQKMPELGHEFAYNAETQRALFKNGETLIGTVNFFISTVNTLCFKTIEDTLDTVKLYEAARLEFDAYRSDLESNGANKSSELQQSYEQHRRKFEQLRQVLDIKLNFLDENKIKVMQQQLVLFHNAIAAYFAGNQTALDETVKQFNIKLKSPNGGMPSWLENQD